MHEQQPSEDRLERVWPVLVKRIRTLFRRQGVYEDDQDLIQQVAIRLISAEARIHSDEQLLAYGYQAAKWVLADFWRGNLEQAAISLESVEDEVTRVPSDEPSQESVLEKKQLLEQVMETMSPRELEAFTAIVVDGLSDVDAAARMDISPSAVRSLLRYAKKRILAFQQ